MSFKVKVIQNLKSLLYDNQSESKLISEIFNTNTFDIIFGFQQILPQNTKQEVIWLSSLETMKVYNLEL